MAAHGAEHGGHGHESGHDGHGEHKDHGGKKGVIRRLFSVLTLTSLSMFAFDISKPFTVDASQKITSSFFGLRPGGGGGGGHDHGHGHGGGAHH